MDLLKVLKVSETISEIDYKKLKEVLVLEFYMAFAKLIKKFLTNLQHLHLFYWQSKLPQFSEIFVSPH